VAAYPHVLRGRATDHSMSDGRAARRVVAAVEDLLFARSYSLCYVTSTNRTGAMVTDPERPFGMGRAGSDPQREAGTLAEAVRLPERLRQRSPGSEICWRVANKRVLSGTRRW